MHKNEHISLGSLNRYLAFYVLIYIPRSNSSRKAWKWWWCLPPAIATVWPRKIVHSNKRICLFQTVINKIKNLWGKISSKCHVWYSCHAPYEFNLWFFLILDNFYGPCCSGWLVLFFLFLTTFMVHAVVADWCCLSFFARRIQRSKLMRMMGAASHATMAGIFVRTSVPGEADPIWCVEELSLQLD